MELDKEYVVSFSAVQQHSNGGNLRDDLSMVTMFIVHGDYADSLTSMTRLGAFLGADYTHPVLPVRVIDMFRVLRMRQACIAGIGTYVVNEGGYVDMRTTALVIDVDELMRILMADDWDAHIHEAMPVAKSFSALIHTLRTEMERRRATQIHI
jgi:hypothetical protein